ncbi:MAG: peptidylprolylisomerase [Candidatus Scalindua rubra]|uniref:Peptidyl-prolyl cis-trans isomerase n=1 Tax=Candidatus Scalindua rubra TaxID=1872076 RepID=A0A1E3X918_9BACT|nr:MAG: peptidylprolylisomerase [Candidatus Scalindua rubra]
MRYKYIVTSIVVITLFLPSFYLYLYNNAYAEQPYPGIERLKAGIENYENGSYEDAIFNLEIALIELPENDKDNPIVLFKTSKGDIMIELFEKDAPITVKNFLSYVSEGFYDNLIFHRVIKKFMIQGDGYDSKMNLKKPKVPIKNEATNGLSNKRGIIAIARTNVIDSATSQFFINVVDNNFLDHKNKTSRGYGYAVFGKVLEGMDVVDDIARVKNWYIRKIQRCACKAYNY